MKTLILLSLISTQAEVLDLGTISPRRGIILEHNCPDFQSFKLELIALPSSNKLSLTLTNDLITISNLAPLPSGRIAGGLSVICQDGEFSETKPFKFWLRRTRPPMPEIKAIEFGSEPVNHVPFEWLNKTNSVSYPSIPGATNEMPAMPLPDAKTETYPEMMDRIANPKMRRNQ